MYFLIVTGLSGAGKSATANMLEDIGYYVIDNIPPQLISKFADICMQAGQQMEKVAIVTDIRGSFADSAFTTEMTGNLRMDIEHLKNKGIDVRILFLDASDNVLISRFKETRRVHPLEKKGHTLQSAITSERLFLSKLHELADFYINTDGMSLSKLKDRIAEMFLDNPDDRMTVKVTSFGFKYGMCMDADIVLDVRCLPNPFYIPELKEHTGLDKAVSDYVMQFEQSQELDRRLRDMIDFLIPLYRQEGKSSLVIAFGCTGGKHRSVTFAERMYEHLSDKGIRTKVSHRDIEK
ncbi:MAG: RNase adapter RapZ [Oscillospiraceae bacterium]|nr:RNase adapter RapZ [Oscillospiraceae bacterium]